MKLKYKKIVVTGGNGRFAKILKDNNPGKNYYFTTKKKLNILKIRSIEKYLK